MENNFSPKDNPAFLGVSETLIRNGFTDIQLTDLPGFMAFYSKNELILDNDYCIDSIATICKRNVLIEKCSSRTKKDYPPLGQREIMSRPFFSSTRMFKSLDNFKNFLRDNNDKVCVLLVDTRLRYEEACREISNDAYGITIRLSMVDRHYYRP